MGNKIFEKNWLYWIHNANYQNIPKSTDRLLQTPFYTGSLKDKDGPGTMFPAIFFVDCLDRFFSFVMLHKQANFHYQSLFPSQFILWNVFFVSCLSIWWCHDCRILKVQYLKKKGVFKVKEHSSRLKNRIIKMYWT